MRIINTNIPDSTKILSSNRLYAFNIVDQLLNTTKPDQTAHKL